MRFTKTLTLSNSIRFVVCIAILFAMGRCSPVASSLNKANLEKAKPPTTPVTQSNAPNGGATPSDTTENSSGSPIFYFFRYDTKVLDGDTLEENIEKQPTSIIKIKLTEAQVLEFKKSGKTEISISEQESPQAGRGLFEVYWSKNQIDLHQLDTFETVLEPKSKEKSVWALTLASPMDPEIVERVSENLVGITVLITPKTPDPALPPKAGTPITSSSFAPCLGVGENPCAPK
jgi:hypothetical protein